MRLTVEVYNFTVTSIPVITFCQKGSVKAKMNVGNQSYSIAIISYHPGLIEYMIRNFQINFVHSVKGKYRRFITK